MNSCFYFFYPFLAGKDLIGEMLVKKQLKQQIGLFDKGIYYVDKENTLLMCCMKPYYRGCFGTPAIMVISRYVFLDKSGELDVSSFTSSDLKYINRILTPSEAKEYAFKETT